MKKNIKFIYSIKIILFCLIIVIPILFINFKEDEISIIDNRMLLNYNDIVNDSKDINEVFTNIGTYANDRIGFRENMVNLYTYSMDKLFNDMIHPIYQYGKDGFVYMKLPETKVNLRFQEVFSSFIKDFQEYCNERNIKFLYTLEPNKSTVYPEYLPEGYNPSSENRDYLIELLNEKGVNYLNNADTLLEAKENPLFEDVLLYDKKYDAGHWNETGAIVGISAIIDRLNELDNRVGRFDINKYETEQVINETLLSSNFKINEETTNYSLKEYNLEYIEDYEEEIYRHENFRYFTHYKNLTNTEAPRLLIFAGSYFNNKEKFITGNFSEVMKIHNYTNVIDYEYYINIYKPDIVLFESTEYTNTGYHYPIKMMEEKTYIKNIKSYDNLSEDNFVNVDIDNIEISGNNITKVRVPIESDNLLYAYANIDNRILDSKIIREEDNLYIEFSLISKEFKEADSLQLYFISQDEKHYQKIKLEIRN
ncbi:MAG: alginate O-acetyltransferase [Clostridium sp.]|uniref:alginate O-acetyltransferase AlgX-related protein n=1 Tax=Clostridium sp. TaxID=1506 RepID=UPI0025B8D7DD|nr:alginate O-acetyltransferase [Clostridium sp.]MCF0149053.1 alginate O-acetyltransferase [Clostridium sp.]